MLTTLPINANFIIATDCLNGIKLINKDDWSHKEKYSSEEYPLILNIQHAMIKREEYCSKFNKSTKMIHVYTHQDEGNKDEKRKEKEEVSNKEAGFAKLCERVNVGADKLAKEGAKMKDAGMIPIEGMQRIYLVDNRKYCMAVTSKQLLKNHL